MSVVEVPSPNFCRGPAFKTRRLLEMSTAVGLHSTTSRHFKETAFQFLSAVDSDSVGMCYTHKLVSHQYDCFLHVLKPWSCISRLSLSVCVCARARARVWWLTAVASVSFRWETIMHVDFCTTLSHQRARARAHTHTHTHTHTYTLRARACVDLTCAWERTLHLNGWFFTSRFSWGTWHPLRAVSHVIFTLHRSQEVQAVQNNSLPIRYIA